MVVTMVVSPLIAFIPTGVLLLGGVICTFRMGSIYKNKHSKFYSDLDVSSSYMIGSPLQAIQILVGNGRVKSIIHPVTEERVGLEKIYDDLNVVKLVGDDKLIKLYKIRKVSLLMCLVYGPLSPIIAMFIWLAKYQV